MAGLPWHQLQMIGRFTSMHSIYDMIERIGCGLARHARNGIIARAYAVLPMTRGNNLELRKLLAR